MTWLEQMRDESCLKVAAALGLRVVARASGSWITPCPACAAPTRHTKHNDRRGAVGVTPDRKGWRCFQCDASGDALRLVELVIGGGLMRDLDDGTKATVRQWCEALLGIDGSSPASHPRPRRSLRPRLAPPTVAPEYPPRDQVAALWRAAVPVLRHGPAAAFLRSRGIDPVTVGTRDLARALPSGATLPRWAAYGGRSWHEAEYHLLVPMVDTSGALRSLVARSLRRQRVPGANAPKSLPPKGYARAGLVMANALARTVLESSSTPAWWTGPRLRFVVTEGELDFLTAGSAASDADEHAPAVLGIVSGSWTAALTARLPAGVSLFVHTDPDEEGAKYAAKVLQTFSRRRDARVALAKCFEAEWSGDRAVVRLREASCGA